MLIEEFARVGIDFSVQNRRLIDAQQIFYKMEPRTLKAALKFYCGQNLENAHDAMSDTKATAQVFWGQIENKNECQIKKSMGRGLPLPSKERERNGKYWCNDGV